MAKRELFRVGIILGPKGLHSLGVTHGNWDTGCEFLQSARPLIADFVNRFQSAYATWTSEKHVSCSEDFRK
jgi:hypothetical protein